MPTKHCAFANCTSDSRHKQDNVKFVPFIKPRVDKKKCLKWIHLSRRTDLTIEKIKKHTYVCTKHFINPNGPTIENPNPLAATVSKIPKDRKRKQRCTEEDLSSVKRKRPNLIHSATTDQSLTGINVKNNKEVETVSKSDSSRNVRDAESQTEEDTEVKQLKKYIKSLENKLNIVAFDVDSCRKNAEEFKYCTGLKTEDFDTLWEF